MKLVTFEIHGRHTLRFDVAGSGTRERKIVAGEHVVDHLGNGVDGLLQAPRELAGV